MKLTRGKIVIIIISIGIAIFFAGLYAFGKWQEEMLCNQVEIELVGVNVTAVDNVSQNMNMQVDIGLFDKSDVVLTVFEINYQLFANNYSLGNGEFSAKDKPLPSRPAIFPDSSTLIPSSFTLSYSDEIREIWNLLIDKGKDNNITWKAKGTVIIQSAFVECTVDFESST